MNRAAPAEIRVIAPTVFLRYTNRFVAVYTHKGAASDTPVYGMLPQKAQRPVACVPGLTCPLVRCLLKESLHIRGHVRDIKTFPPFPVPYVTKRACSEDYGRLPESARYVVQCGSGWGTNIGIDNVHRVS
jgi:hypothetical protein